MKNVDIEIPPDTRTVTLALSQAAAEPTLRTVLSVVKGSVELHVEGSVYRPEEGNRELWRVRAGSGKELIELLEKSGLVDGMALLSMQGVTATHQPGRPGLVNGSICDASDGCTAVHVSKEGE